MRNPFLLLFFIGPLLIAQNKDFSAHDAPIPSTPSEIDFITRLATIDTSLTSQEINAFKATLKQFIATLPEKEEKERREEKRIKKIYNQIHHKFFKKYKDVAFFPELVAEGVYNCVTATALYAEVFEMLEIPFEVKEAPAHVYLIAYPQTLKIYLETTVPGRYGFFSISDNQRKKTVDELVELKLFTAEEVREKGYSQIYQEYFFGKKILEKEALIGIHFYNSAIFHYENKDYQTALEHINSSLELYESDFSKPLKRELLGQMLEELGFNKKEEVDYLFKVFEGLEFREDYSPDQLKVYLSKIILHDDNDLNFIEEAAIKFSGLTDSIAAKVSKQFFYDHIAEKHILRRNFAEAIRTADTLLSLDENSKLAKDILAAAVPSKISYIGNDKEALEQMDSFIQKYPFLLSDKRTLSLKALLLIKLAYYSYEKRNEKEAVNYLRSFEEQVQEYEPLLQIEPQAIKTLYLAAGRYYYGRNRYKEALTRFNKGLSYLPSDAELNKMARWVKEDMAK